MINATSNGSTQKELIPAGNYIARCYQMIHIGTVEQEFQGTLGMKDKVRIGWELPTELKVFNPEKGEQPLVISNEYTLSMHEKSSLRAMLKSWRGKDFTEEEAKKFDVTKLIGKPCMINIIHSKSKDGTKTYANIAGVTAMPKGMEAPPQINPTFVLSYDEWDENKFGSLPEFIRNKMSGSLEFQKMMNPTHNEVEEVAQPIMDDLPF